MFQSSIVIHLEVIMLWIQHFYSVMLYPFSCELFMEAIIVLSTIFTNSLHNLMVSIYKSEINRNKFPLLFNYSLFCLFDDKQNDIYWKNFTIING